MKPSPLLPRTAPRDLLEGGPIVATPMPRRTAAGVFLLRDIISKVNSSAQTGVDIAALRAAKSRGVPTGGTMPKGFRTLIGPRPDWAIEFGLVEHKSSAYPPRTFQNVRDSDIAIRIAVDFDSAGERLTAKAIERYNRTWFDVPVRYAARYVLSGREADIFIAIEAIKAEALLLGRPVVVHFAGNSERTAPGIEVCAEGVVAMILDGVVVW